MPPWCSGYTDMELMSNIYITVFHCTVNQWTAGPQLTNTVDLVLGIISNEEPVAHGYNKYTGLLIAGRFSILIGYK